MSLLPYGSFFNHHPFALLDQFFDEASQQLQLRDHAGKLNLTKDGFSYKVDVSGFQPNEVKVDIQGGNIVIKGDHRVMGERCMIGAMLPDETVERSFVRRLRIPDNVQKESIVADIDERGHLVIAGKQVAVEQPHVRSIPINVKGATAAGHQQKQ